MPFPKKQVPTHFTKPTELPPNDKVAAEWQHLNKSFWENSPMLYDWTHPHTSAWGTSNFFRDIDSVFFQSAEGYFPPSKIPFDCIIPYLELQDKDVLEVGIGSGSHAALLAAHAKTFTGIDLTEKAVANSQKRFELESLKGNLLQMDAEKMTFPDNSFDFVWSWGVIHHSSNTSQILREILRVSKPGGTVKLMVYHRGWWNYYFTGVLTGIKNRKIKSTADLHEFVQKKTDGALARYYTKKDFIKIVPKGFGVSEIYSIGPKTDLLLIPKSNFKSFLMKIIPNRLNRFLTRNLRMGSFLIVCLKAEK